jgi:hypothetical protein
LTLGGLLEQPEAPLALSAVTGMIIDEAGGFAV